MVGTPRISLFNGESSGEDEMGEDNAHVAEEVDDELEHEMCADENNDIVLERDLDAELIRRCKPSLSICTDEANLIEEDINGESNTIMILYDRRDWI